MKKPELKRYIVRKYIMAKSGSEALRKEKNFLADECWVDDEWMKTNKEVSSHMGYRIKKK